MTRRPWTRDELLDALTVERFGPLTPEYHNPPAPVAESATDQVIRRYELALAVDNITPDSTDAVGSATASPDSGGAAAA